ncbi:MAG: hypothetical protein Q7U60_08345, partial [Candidatus Methanoperedens sp.]|nr:hypothetical protein [Candidatus Methanoperedens sp.]
MITQGVDKQWQEAFLKTVQQHENALPLKEAALQERLGDWTKELTSVVVATCEVMGWQASAKDHRLDMLPVPRSEYLALDVMAFARGEKRWRFPAAIFELENSKNDDNIAYSLWKTICVKADLRVVFCYRRNSDEGSDLVRFLRDEVVHAMDLEKRIKLEGKTIVVVGSRNDSATFPYGFFK